MTGGQPHIQLNSGCTMPLVGFGTFQITDEDASSIVRTAIEVGYRHFDCAFAYQNQVAIGKAFRECIRDGLVKREDLFITSKIWNTFHSRAECTKNAEQILQQLQLDYVDLLLMHWPTGYKENCGTLFPMDDDKKHFTGSDVDYMETWSALTELWKAGKAKSIGVSNFNISQLTRLMESGVAPAVNQVECHPWLPVTKLYRFCKDKGIVLTAYRSLRIPVDSESSGFPASSSFGLATADEPTKANLLAASTITAIANEHKKSPAQILLRWAVQRNIAVIPKSSKKSRLAENFSLFDFALTAANMAEIASLDKKGNEGRSLKFEMADNHKYYPFAEEF